MKTFELWFSILKTLFLFATLNFSISQFALAQTAVLESDSLALVALYNATDGKNWIHNNNWLIGPVSTWWGVSSDGNRVLGVDLTIDGLLRIGNNLTGTLPDELGNMTELRYLCIGFNSFLEGTLPNLSNLTKLWSLELPSNNISVEIPIWIGQMTELINLTLSGNLLSGSIPEELYNLTNLQHLGLSGQWCAGQISGSISPSISKLINLKSLNLECNQLEGALPPEIGNLINLETLSLAQNNFSGSLPSELWNLNKLGFLYIPNNNFDGEIPPQIGQLNNLTVLGIWNNNFTGNFPTEVYNLNKLTRLSIGGNSFDFELTSEIGNLVNLTEFEINTMNSVIGEIPPEIGNLTKLEILAIANNHFTGELPDEIGKLKNLRSIEIWGNNLTGIIPEEISELPNLDYLDINYNKFVEIPSMPNIDSIFSCMGNRLTFEDFERNLSFFHKQNIELYYIGQQAFGREYDTTAIEGKSFTLSIPCGGIYNHYQWWKNGTLLSNAPDASELGFSSIQLSDAGTYYITVTNDSVPDLELTSFPVHLTIEEHCMKQDSLALVALYNATDGPNWTRNDNWLTGPVNTWWGVTCSECSVLELVLQIDENTGNNLSGELPSEIGDLSDLHHLRLRNNHLSGTFPEEMSRLSNLQKFYIDNNQISGNIPPWLGNLTNMIELGLGGNQFVGQIPVELSLLTNLITLYLDGPFNSGKLIGTLPNSFVNLIQLRTLIISNNQLSGNIPAILGNLNNLETLWLNNNLFIGNIPDEIFQLHNLKQFYLDYNNLSGELSAQIGNFENMQEFTLSNNEFTGNIPVEIKNLDKLRILNLEQNHFVELPSIKDISGFLACSNNNLTFEDFERNLDLIRNTTIDFQYSPQYKFGREYDTIAIEGSSFNLSIPCGGIYNHYQWWKDVTLLSNAPDASELNFSSIQLSDAGTYYITVSNDSVPDLTLQSYPVHLTLLNIPTLSSPSNNSIDQAITMELQWNEVLWADNYSLQLSTSADFSTLLIDQVEITTTEFSTDYLQEGTQYFWRVNASSVAGTSGWSDVWSFTTQSIGTELIPVNLIIIDGQHSPIFQITGIEQYPDNTLTIFTQWGKKVYEKNSYNNELDFSDYPAETYYYVLTVEKSDGIEQIKNFVDVVKP